MAFNSPFWNPSEASAVLFDWDGVIADTKLDFSKLRHKYYGDRPAMLLEDAVTLTSESRKSLMRDLEDLEVRGAENASLVPGVPNILEWVEKSRIPWAVVSRNCRRSILTAAKRIGVTLPRVVRSRDDGERVKPDPEALREVCSQLGADAADTLLIGDYIYDMMGARRAGMRGILVRKAIQDDWDQWMECHYTSMYEFYDGLSNHAKITAWEYRDARRQYGADFLRKVHAVMLPIPEQASPGMDSWVSRAASLGVGGFIVPDGKFTPENWRQNPSLSIEYMGMPMETVLRDFVKKRWPFAKVVRAQRDEKIPAPPGDSDRLAEYLLSLVS